MADTRLRELDLAAGQTLTVDCRGVESPLRWDATAAGAVLSVDASHAPDPQAAADWHYADAVRRGETCGGMIDAPIGWLRWRAAAAGTGSVRLAFRGRIVATVA